MMKTPALVEKLYKTDPAEAEFVNRGGLERYSLNLGSPSADLRLDAVSFDCGFLRPILVAQ